MALSQGVGATMAVPFIAQVDQATAKSCSHQLSSPWEGAVVSSLPALIHEHAHRRAFLRGPQRAEVHSHLPVFPLSLARWTPDRGP